MSQIRRAPALSVLLALASGVGCGGEAPSAAAPSLMQAPTPTPAGHPAGTVLTIVSGDNGAPIVGADVRVAGQSLRSDASGAVVLPATAPAQARVEIQAPDYLPRSTVLARGPRLTLWPAENRAISLTPDYTRKLVYTPASQPEGSAVHSMYRLAPGVTRVSVLPGPEVRAVPEAMAALTTATERMTAAVGIPFVVDETASAPFVVHVIARERPDTPCGIDAAACASIRGSGWGITGSTIHFVGSGATLSLQRADIHLHELGHAIGLGHSLRAGDIMAPANAERRRRADFSDVEWLTIRMILARPPGNQFPDDDTSVALASAAPGQDVVDCD